MAEAAKPRRLLIRVLKGFAGPLRFKLKAQQLLPGFVLTQLETVWTVHHNSGNLCRLLAAEIGA